jgi:putative hydrolase of the HAD superfamily
MIKAIFIDMDDTLIVNSVLYKHALFKLKGFLSHFGITADEVDKAHEAAEKELYPQLGYSRARYPLSFEKTLQHFIPDADAQLIATVRDFAEEVFRTIAPPKPDSAEALELLASLYPVYIVTQGDRSVQQARIDNLPFKDKLSGAFIVDKKSKETFADLAATLGIAPQDAIMIGDSLKSDIVTATEAGLKGVWIEAANWAMVETAEFPKERAYKFSSLMECARYLKQNGDITTKPGKGFFPAPRDNAP